MTIAAEKIERVLKYLKEDTQQAEKCDSTNLRRQYLDSAYQQFLTTW